MAGTIFPKGTVGYARIQADEAMARRERQRNRAWGVALAVLLAWGAWVSFGCTNKLGAERALVSAGYERIKLTGYRWACSQDDWSCTGFEAYSPGGEVKVTGAVGCGAVFKGCTIRID